MAVNNDEYANYFVAGNLLCIRWHNSGEETENREWWENTINGSTFIAIFEMSKVD